MLILNASAIEKSLYSSCLNEWLNSGIKIFINITRKYAVDEIFFITEVLNMYLKNSTVFNCVAIRIWYKLNLKEVQTKRTCLFSKKRKRDYITGMNIYQAWRLFSTVNNSIASEYQSWEGRVAITCQYLMRNVEQEAFE